MHQFNDFRFEHHLWLGVGFQNSVTAADLAESIDHLLQAQHIRPTRIKGLATISHRAAHPAIRQLLGKNPGLDRKPWQLQHFSPVELGMIAVPNPSIGVFKRIETLSVAEAAAQLAAGGELIVHKQIMWRSSGYVTLAVAAEPENLASDY
jgi:cobalamin biosynthesis protein CbiG